MSSSLPSYDLDDRNKYHMTKDPIIRYVCEKGLRLSPAQKKLIDATLKQPQHRMLGSADEMQLLANLCRSIGAKKTIDIGVYTGYSALSIAEALPADGKVLACDVTDTFLKEVGGDAIWKEAGMDQKIDLVLAPAIETLQKKIDGGEAGTYDFAFIDADKGNYVQYYQLCLELLRPGGLIAVDNAVWSGRVTEPSINDPDTTAIRACNDLISKDERVHISFLTVGDGTFLAWKK